MWGVVIGLLLVSAAIAEDAVNTTSDSSEEVKEADKVEKILNESRRYSSDDINANTLRSLQISNPINNLIPNQQQPSHAAVSLPNPSSPQINGQVNNVPPSNILQRQSGFYSTIPNLNVPTIKDSNLYYSQPSSPQINGQVNNAPPSNILQDSNLYYSQPSSPQINGQVNNMPPSNILQDSSLHYVSPLVTQSHEIGIHPPPLRNILQQNILNQPGSTQESSCSGHSEVLYRVWLILRTLLDSGPRSPYINQIQQALMLLTNYLKELNPGNLNNDYIMSLEKELEEKRIYPQLPMTWNINPGLGFDVPPSNLGRTGNFSPNCKKSLLKLIELTQATFASILKSPDCQENHIDQSSDSYPYQIPYFNQNVYNTGTYPLDQLFDRRHVLNQKPIGSPDLNALLSSPINPSIVGTPNEFQHNPLREFMNSNFVDVQSSPYSPYGYSFHTSVKSGSQFENPEISIPTQPLGVWYNSQNQQPPSAIPLKRENSSPQVPNNPLIGGYLNGYTNHIINNPGARTIPNNFHQQINLNTPPGSLITPPNSSPIDQHALWSTLQDMPSNPAYRQNIQNYLSSQTVQHHNYQVPPQSGSYVNVNPPVNNNILPLTHVTNNGFVSNVQPGSLPSQNHGSYHQSYSQSTPYMNNPNLPMHNFTGQNMYSFKQNPYQGIGSMRTQTSAIDWHNILNGSNLGPNNTPNGEVELTFAIRRTDQNQPLYFVKYRIPYNVFIQNIRGLLSRRSGDSDIAKGLVISANASEVPKELASFRHEELTQVVIKEGVLANARYIDGSDNTSSSAANSINALLDNTINKNVDNITAKDDFTRSQPEVSNSG